MPSIDAESSPVKQVVAVIIVGQATGRVLTCRRVDSGLWAFTAGDVEEGETPEEAAERRFAKSAGFGVAASSRYCGASRMTATASSTVKRFSR